MPTLSRCRIRTALASAAAEGAARRRGQLLEELIAYVFARCPGVRHYRNNLLNRAGSSEIDVCFWNKRRIDSLDFLPRGLLVVECKNTQRPVTSAAVRVFRTKLVDMGLRDGILVAANGITGNPERLSAAHDAIRTAFQVDRVRILVITRAELESLATTDDLVDMLQNKIMLLTLQSRTFET